MTKRPPTYVRISRFDLVLYMAGFPTLARLLQCLRAPRTASRKNIVIAAFLAGTATALTLGGTANLLYAAWQTTHGRSVTGPVTTSVVLLFLAAVFGAAAELPRVAGEVHVPGPARPGMFPGPDQDRLAAAVADVELATTVRDADLAAELADTNIRLLAESLLSIAEKAMPEPLLTDDFRCQLARAVLAMLLQRAEDAYLEDTCGDCKKGRCHWGGITSRMSIQMVEYGEEYEDPTFGRCGCARHSTSVVARYYQRDTFEETALAWQAAKDAGEVVPLTDEDGTIWVSRPSGMRDGS